MCDTGESLVENNVSEAQNAALTRQTFLCKQE